MSPLCLGFCPAQDGIWPNQSCFPIREQRTLMRIGGWWLSINIENKRLLCLIVIRLKKMVVNQYYESQRFVVLFNSQSSDWKTHHLHILVRWTRSCHSHTAPAIPEPQYYSHLMIIIYKPLTRTFRTYCLDKEVENYHHNSLWGPLRIYCQRRSKLSSQYWSYLVPLRSSGTGAMVRAGWWKAGG